MIIKRQVFFPLLFLILIAPYFGYKLFWTWSAKKAVGTVAFTGKDISTQMEHVYCVIMFSTTGKDTVFFNSGDNELFTPGEKVPVLYQPDEPKDAHVNGWIGIWLDAVIYGIIMFVMVGIIFLHPSIVPYRSNIQLQLQRPWISVV
ncbi:MAG: DUF3592 domain-containing protein [Agriterribacter sp.]